MELIQNMYIQNLQAKSFQMRFDLTNSINSYHICKVRLYHKYDFNKTGNVVGIFMAARVKHRSCENVKS